MNEVYSGAQERLVIPGDTIGESGDFTAGSGVIKVENKLIATQLGHVKENNGTVYLEACNSAYMPRSGDLVIGFVTSMRGNLWMFNIGGPFEALLPMSLSPWNTQFGDLEEHMGVGDYALLRVQEVDSQHGVVCTMKGIGLRKITTGVVENIGSNSIKMFVGSEGNNLQKIKKNTGCRITVAENGKIWIEGDEEGISKVRSISLDFSDANNPYPNLNLKKTFENKMEEI
ncbi:MAG: Uncharacterised protein [Methanobacteriota archaeon]|nr:MAG: Uncharacterised protein [Euryarchaeota archaeon]